MAQLFPRKFAAILAGSDGKGLDLSGLSCTFKVCQSEAQTPNTCDLRILNLSDATALKAGKEFSRLVVQAGYEGQFGTIFDGNVVQYRRGRTSPVDTYLDVTAGDGDRAHNFATVSTTLAAGATPADVHKALCTTMDPHGVGVGHTDPLPGPALPRGRVLYGMTRDHLRTLADATGTTWSIQNGKVQFVSRTGYLPGEAVVLRADTGLIGLPQQTQDGITVRCLLNPLLRVNGRIKLDNRSIQLARTGVLHGEGDKAIPDFRQVQALPKLDTDGVYRVLAIDHFGASRGQDWYSDLVCIALDGTVPTSQVPRLRGGDAPPASVRPPAAP